MASSLTPSQQVLKTHREFLESTPPETYEDVVGLFSRRGTTGLWDVSSPDLLLHCSSEECNGLRFYKQQKDTISVPDKGWARGYLSYACRNCGKGWKVYAVTVHRESGDQTDGRAYKYGEYPTYGPSVPARVISLIGPDREFFLLGRKAETRGLGIGAFAYYRRVVENQKSRIITEIAKVAEKLGADEQVLRDFEKAANETQFTTAIDDIKQGLPSVLFIDGHNPLTLLHKALSEGLHAQDDKTCLELSESIRLVLTELAERMASVLKDQHELKTAVSKLLNRKSGQ